MTKLEATADTAFRHSTLNFNLLHAALRYGCDTWMVDFLLGKKVSPMEVDSDG